MNVITCLFRWLSRVILTRSSQRKFFYLSCFISFYFPVSLFCSRPHTYISYLVCCVSCELQCEHYLFITSVLVPAIFNHFFCDDQVFVIVIKMTILNLEEGAIAKLHY